MSLLVQKFGGTSVGTTERIQSVAEKVSNYRRQGHDVVVVVSAMSGETNRLVEMAKQMQAEPDPREYDVLVSTGEQVTIALLCMALKNLGFDAKSYTGGQVRITTDDTHSKARIQKIDDESIRKDLAKGRIVVVAGFQGTDEQGNITTLGRGGSDTSAVALAAALKADECQIYTDVDGVYTTDPRVVSTATRLEKITFEEMLEMASLGSDEAKLTILGIPDTPGIASKILAPVGDANVEVDVIVQNVAADQTTDLTFTVNRSEMAKAQSVLEVVKTELGAKEVVTNDSIVKVSIVGVGMRSHAGVAAKMFKTLAEENVNIQMITTSEIKISVIIDERYLELAVRSLHKAFELDQADA